MFSPAGVKDTRTFLIAALPLTLGYDGSDNLLDPTRGFRLSGWISPEFSGHGASLTYARTQIDASAYHPVSDRVVVAGRIRLGTILGASTFDLAPSRRFYSGGGGSVRGYGYQQLGPKDVDGDPIGGRGLAEFALEARIRLKQFGGNFGIVPVLRRRLADDRDAARLQQLALRGRAGRRAIIRSSARSASMSACRSTARKATGRSRSRSRSARPSRWPSAVVDRGRGAPPRPAARRTGRGGCSTSCSRFHRAAVPARGALVLLDSAPGHRFIVDRHRQTRDRIGPQASTSGASTARSSASRSCATSPSPTSSGVFLTSPNIKLDWTPGAWLANKLRIDSLTAERVTLIRLPKLKPSTKKGPILPGFDIHIGELRIDRLDIGPAVGGKPRSGRVRGKADVHSGRALVELQALITQWRRPHRVPPRCRARPRQVRPRARGSIAPANGLVPAMVGTKRAIDLAIGGKGSWTRWRGTASLDLSGRPTARLALGVDNGRYRLQGKWAPAQFLTGKLQRLTVPVVTIRGVGDAQGPAPRWAADGASPELRAVAKGAVDLARQPLPRPAARDRPGEAAGAVPQHDGQECSDGVDARRAVRDRRLFVPADLRFREVRQYRLRGPPCRGAGAAVAVADARAAPAFGARDHRHRRRCRRDARQPEDRRLADDHPQAGARRRASGSPAPNGTASCRS